MNSGNFKWSWNSWIKCTVFEIKSSQVNDVKQSYDDDNSPIKQFELNWSDWRFVNVESECGALQLMN